MARPSQQIDEALLHSGRELYARLGCAGITVRAVTEHAGVPLGMFHYHFRTKDNFLRTLLQQIYEELFARLAGPAQQGGSSLERLRAALIAMAQFGRAHRALIARLWMDAMAGEAVARDFFSRNAPRHVTLLMGLMQQAAAEGLLRELPPVQRFAFTMGSVMMPIIFVAGLIDAGFELPIAKSHFERQVMSDAALAERVDLALAALLQDRRGGRR